MTIICAAPLATVERPRGGAALRWGNSDGAVWQLDADDARARHRIGVKQAIYHRGRDAQASGQQWGEADLARMKALSDIGLQLSVTGGITPADLPLFKQINIKAFIAGRALADAANPPQVEGLPFPQTVTSGSVIMRQHPLGIYEKALPKSLTWPERLVLAKAVALILLEMSVDETDERLSRLAWSTTQRASLVEAMLETGVSILHVPVCPPPLPVWQPGRNRARRAREIIQRH